jgi:hypothetical protein
MRSDGDAFNEFLKKWRRELKTPTEGWEGFRAVENLKRAGYTEGNVRTSMITFVRCAAAEGWRPLDMLRKVFAEVKDYKRQRVAWRKEFRDTEISLAKLERTVAVKALRIKHPALKRFLSNTAVALEQRRRIVRHFIDRSAFRSPLGTWERLWPKHTRSEVIRREIDLDTRLQLQCAKMFRTFLHEDEGVSRRTIARLVVLVFRAAELASEFNNEGFLRIVDSKRAVTVRSVEEKLIRNGIR